MLDNFETLLVADAKSPAMGDYLDNRRNWAGAINENYSRELLELHTVSVTGPYTETDVVELARCLTGWLENYANAVDGFSYQNELHDQGAKTVMGVSIPANGGMNDGLTMLDFLAHHPDTARFIARKLIVRLLSESPPQRLVDEAAGVFLGTGGDLRAVVESIVMSPEFLTFPQYRKTKVKRPLHFFASSIRALGADPTGFNTNNIRNRVAQLGEDLYEAGPPTGYPDVSAYWISPGTAMNRVNETDAMSRGQYGLDITYPIAGGTSTQITDALIGSLFLGPVSPETRGATIGFLDVLPAPDDTTRIRQAAAVLLSAPSPEALRRLRCLTRRTLLQSAAVGMTALLLPPWARRARAAGHRPVLVSIFQRGAADALNTVIPTGDPVLLLEPPERADRRRHGAAARRLLRPEPGVRRSPRSLLGRGYLRSSTRSAARTRRAPTSTPRTSWIAPRRATSRSSTAGSAAT